MIDPDKLTNFQRSEAELQELWLFSIAVAGKPAFRIAKQTASFVKQLPYRKPFDGIRYVLDSEGFEGLFKRVHAAKFGQHNRIAKAYSQSIDLDLTQATVDDLMKVHGVGPKTARMFILHSREHQRFAVLDTHILKFLKTKGIKVPDTTPTGRRYLDLEKGFLSLADHAGMSPADFDLSIWRQYASRP